MDVDETNTSLDFFLSWKVEALRSFLEKRGMSKDGTKAELAALCFAASKMQVPIQPSSIALLKANKHSYSGLLKVTDDFAIPDPFSLSSGWCSEKDGLRLWPPVYLSDITSFFMKTCPDTTTDHFLNEYKVGKAYEYFSCNWIKEVFYQRLGDFSLLRAACSPSQKLSNPDHKVWVCVEQSTGKIMSAYCSCTAGLGQTCNHVAGLLFRLEYANRMGMSNPACTSVPCSWKVPKQKVEFGPKPISEMIVKKSRHGKSAKSRPLVSTTKKEYEVIPASEELVPRSPLESLGEALANILPDACLYKGFVVNQNEGSVDRDSQIKNSMEETMPNYNIKEYAKQFTDSPTQQKEFIDKFPTLSSSEIHRLSELTKAQSGSDMWYDTRKCRITASRFYAVHTKMESMKRDSSVDATLLLKNLMGETGLTDPEKLPRQIKHGRNLEPVAKREYYSTAKKHHHNLQQTDSGFLIFERSQFLGASPDGLISCSCCGDGVLEIKCPLKPPCTVCNPKLCTCTKLLPYLKVEDGIVKLNHNHAYYGQIQGQMAVTGRHYCDFYVYTPTSSHLERIKFNKSFWEYMLDNLVQFYKQYMVPYIINYASCEDMAPLSNLDRKDEEMEVDQVQNTVYFCPVCDNQIKEEENVFSFKERSICCDTCNKWFHFKCVKVTKAMLQSNVSWYCANCKI